MANMPMPNPYPVVPDDECYLQGCGDVIHARLDFTSGDPQQKSSSSADQINWRITIVAMQKH